MTSPMIPSSFQYNDAPQGGSVMPMVIAGRNPSNTTDKQYSAGYLWLSSLDIRNSNGTTGSGNLYYQGGNVSGIPSWTLVSNSGGVLNTLSNGITTVAPVGGNIALVGVNSNQIVVTAAVGQLIFSIPNTFIAPGSIASTTTMTVGTNLTVVGDATIGDDLVVTDDASIGGDLTVSGTITLSVVTAALGFGTMATQASTAYTPTGTSLLIANNLSDLDNAATARINLGLSDANKKTMMFSVNSGNLSVAVTTGAKESYVRFPWAGTISQWSVLGTPVSGQTTGSIVFDVWRSTFNAFPPVSAGTITDASKPTISGAVTGTGVVTASWVNTITAGECYKINVDSCTNIAAATLVLEVTLA